MERWEPISGLRFSACFFFSDRSMGAPVCKVYVSIWTLRCSSVFEYWNPTCLWCVDVKPNANDGRSTDVALSFHHVCFLQADFPVLFSQDKRKSSRRKTRYMKAETKNRRQIDEEITLPKRKTTGWLPVRKLNSAFPSFFSGSPFWESFQGPLFLLQFRPEKF